MAEMICSKKDRCKLGENCPHKLRPPAVCYEYENKRSNYDDLNKSKRSVNNESTLQR